MTYQRTWRGSIFSSVLSPVLFLAAMGLGVGSLVDDSGTGAALEGSGYLTFLAPGLLAASAMQTAAFESSFPVMAGIKWLKTYHAQLATPLGVADVALGQLAWIGLRLCLSSSIFTAVIAAFGAADSVLVVAAMPVAVLTGLAFAAPIAAFTASLDNEAGLSALLRFGIIPLFLFSGTFFPIGQLPDALEPLAYLSPLWHGVELCRALALGEPELVAALVHVAYLGLWAGVGAVLAVWRFRARLVT